MGAPRETEGPLLWRSWRAHIIGQPRARFSTEGSILLRPPWQEFSLWSDASFSMAGDGKYGPFTLLLAFSSPDGTAKQALVLRADDHLLPATPSEPEEDWEAESVAGYAGGDQGDQFASLLALALNRRIRSAGVTRMALGDHDQIGAPCEPHQRQPFLPPVRRVPMLPGIDEPAHVDVGTPLLNRYGTLGGQDALTVQRAANQFADALWWAEVEPRVAWIKLFGAIESAAATWDRASHVDAVAQLRARHPKLAGKLAKHHPNALPLVADEVAGSIGVESKMRAFLLEHLPDPPAVRPAVGQLSFAPDDIASSLRTLYRHRSNELHGGLPIPPPLCLPPHPMEDGTTAEVPFGLAMSTEGGSWPASSYPMTLATFTYLVGGALRKWWLGLPIEAPVVA